MLFFKIKKMCVYIYIFLTGYVDCGWLFLRSLLSSVALSFVEAQTNQVDNLALPLLMYVCLMV